MKKNQRFHHSWPKIPRIPLDTGGVKECLGDPCIKMQRVEFLWMRCQKVDPLPEDFPSLPVREPSGQLGTDDASPPGAIVFRNGGDHGHTGKDADVPEIAVFQLCRSQNRQWNHYPFVLMVLRDAISMRRIAPQSFCTERYSCSGI